MEYQTSKTLSRTRHDAPTGHKHFNFISFSFQSRRWAHIKRSAEIMIPVISTCLSVLGSIGVIFFGLLASRHMMSKPKHPSPATIGLYVFMTIFMTGALLADQTRTDESGIFKCFYLFGFFAALFSIGWSYRCLYRRLTPNPGSGDNLEAESGPLE